MNLLPIQSWQVYVRLFGQFDYLSIFQFGPVSRFFYNDIKVEGEPFANCFMDPLVLLGENRFFVEDYVTALDQFLILWVPYPIAEFPIGHITKKYAFRCMGCQLGLFLTGDKCLSFAYENSKPIVGWLFA